MSDLTLWQLYRQTGDSSARDTLVVESIGLVHHVARQLRRRSSATPHEELVSAGMVGLLQAVSAFDPDRGYSFTTFAVRRIRGAILDELRRADPLSRHARQKCRALSRANQAVERRLKRRPSPVEIATELGIGLESYWEWRNLTAVAPGADGEDEFGEGLREEASAGGATPIEEQLEKEGQLELLKEMILGLPEQQRIVLSLHYFEGLQQSDIAIVLGLTASRISQIHKQALRHLRACVARV